MESHEPAPLSFRDSKFPAESGVTERGIQKCLAAITEHHLDLAACLEKGGSWRVAASRILSGGDHENLTSGQLNERALRDLSRPLDEIPLLAMFAAQSPEWRNTLEGMRKVIADPNRAIEKDPFWSPLYFAFVNDQEGEVRARNALRLSSE
jgi:hypothetical protein